MRVLHIGITQNMGGIERFIFNNFLQLKDKEIFFDCLTSENVDFSIFDEEENLNCIRIPSPKCIFQYVYALIHIIRMGNYDVIHIHKNSLINSIPIYLSVIFSAKSTKVIVHAHNTAPKGGSKYIYFLHDLNRVIISYLNVVRLACSHKASQYMFGNKKSQIIYNGIDFNQFKRNNIVRNKLRRKYGFLSDYIVLGDVASLIEQKNLLYLIDIFYELYKKNEKYRLILVGEGQEREQIENKIKDLNLNHVILLTGSVENVEAYLSMFDIFVMPSLFEGLPISAIEAQVAGLPLVISQNVDDMVVISKEVHMIPVDNAAVNQWISMIENINHRENILNVELSNKFNICSSSRYLYHIYES